VICSYTGVEISMDIEGCLCYSDIPHEYNIEMENFRYYAASMY
jgi:hypothetical protein